MTRMMAVRSAFPMHRYSQAELTSKVAELSGLDPAERALLERLHGNSGVDYRHIVLPLSEYRAYAGFSSGLPTATSSTSHSIGPEAVPVAGVATSVEPSPVWPP